MDSVPNALWMSIGAVVAVVVAGRWCLVNDTVMNRFINWALTWTVVGLLLYGFGCVAGERDLGLRLWINAGLLTSANVYGLAALFDGAAVVSALRRQRRYNLAAGGLGAMIIWSPMANARQSIDWLTVGWGAFGLLLTLSGLRIARACWRELRGWMVIGRKQRLLYSGLGIMAVYWVLAGFAGLVRTLMGVSPENPGTAWVFGSFAGLAGLITLLAVPLVDVILARVGWDRTGRHLRRLRPLWTDLTRAVPDVVLPEGQDRGRTPELRLYRMVVEITDALVRLQRYRPPGPPRDMEAELTQLLGLAKTWPESGGK